MSVRGTTNTNDRGSAMARRRRKQWLLDTFGDGTHVVCSFDNCDVILDFNTLTVDRYPIPGAKGGRYNRDNIRPVCNHCNIIDGIKLREQLKEERKNGSVPQDTNN